jgi:hypothetical protein
LGIAPPELVAAGCFIEFHGLTSDYPVRDAAELLGIPYDEVTQVALIPVAYTKGTSLKPAQREPLSTMVHWENW